MSSDRSLPVRLLRAALVVAALFLVVALLVRWFLLERALGERATAVREYEASVLPLRELEGFAPPTPPPSRNAAHRIRAGMYAVALDPEAAELLEELLRTRADTWSEPAVGSARGLLGANREALALLHRAVGMEESSWELDYRTPPGAAMDVPNLALLHGAVRLLALEARLALLDGDPAAAVRAVAAIRAAAGSCLREGPLVFHLVGLSLDRAAWSVARDLVGAGLEDPVALGQLLERGGPESREALRRALSTEALFTVRSSVPDLMGSRARSDAWARSASWVVLPLAKARSDAVLLRRFREAVELFDQGPFVVASDRLAPREPAWDESFAILVGSLRGVVAQYATRDALATLGGEAIRLRSAALREGGWPAEPGPMPSDAITGEPLAWTVGPDGRGVLAVPGADDALFAESDPVLSARSRDSPLAPPLRWELPAP